MILDSVPSSAVYATALGSAARATVEERPFQGRVTNEVEMNFSSCGRVGCRTGLEPISKAV